MRRRVGSTERHAWGDGSGDERLIDRMPGTLISPTTTYSDRSVNGFLAWVALVDRGSMLIDASTLGDDFDPEHLDMEALA